MINYFRKALWNRWKSGPVLGFASRNCFLVCQVSKSSSLLSFIHSQHMLKHFSSILAHTIETCDPPIRGASKYNILCQVSNWDASKKKWWMILWRSAKLALEWLHSFPISKSLLDSVGIQDNTIQTKLSSQVVDYFTWFLEVYDMSANFFNLPPPAIQWFDLEIYTRNARIISCFYKILTNLR